jgi:hypothetical protein
MRSSINADHANSDHVTIAGEWQSRLPFNRRRISAGQADNISSHMSLTNHGRLPLQGTKLAKLHKVRTLLLFICRNRRRMKEAATAAADNVGFLNLGMLQSKVGCCAALRTKNRPNL